MFAVIFELQPKPEKFDEYLKLAKYLKPKLEAIEGFIDIDRFSSRRTKGRLLSLSTWRDEKAIVRWRTQADHHAAQEKGRFEVFEDYHLRVGEITVDTAAPKGRTLQEQRFDATDVGEAKVVTITDVVLQEDNSLGAEVDQLAAHLDLRISSEGLMDQQAFESIYRSGKFLLVAAWREADAAKSGSPTTRYGTPRIALRYPPLLREQERGLDDAISVRHRHVRITRDYGMFDRCETPQFFPKVKRVAREAGALVGSANATTRGRP
jgi:heme-degrading monooxygenase HmoA